MRLFPCLPLLCAAAAFAFAETASDWRVKAEAGDAVAMRELGRCYETGNGVNKLADEAKFWYGKAAAAGDADSYYYLAMLETARQGANDKMPAAALKNLRAGVKLNSPRALDAMGCLYMTGNGVKKDMNEALKLFRKAADLNCVESCYRLGMCYMQGNGVEKNMAEAATLFRKAKELGHNESTALLGSILLAGEGVEKNEEEGLACLRIAADGGSVMAARNLGIANLRALGMEENVTTAIKYLRKAAGMGDNMAMYYLGCCYAEGTGVEPNLRLSGVLLNHALDKGIAKAADALAQLPEEARRKIDNPLDMVMADAEWGNPTAQFQLARYYQLRLDGEEGDDMNADFWLRKAAENGHPAAKAMLEGKYRERPSLD